MSAIAGIIALDPGQPVSDADLTAMLAAMAVNGKDAVETVLDAEGSIAVGRIAHGPDSRQAGSAEAGQLRAFMVGELYNDAAAGGASEAAWMLEKYRLDPMMESEPIPNGSFAAAIVDVRDHSVTLLTDPTNSRPLFTRSHGGLLYFASEVKALAALPELPCQVDVSSVLALLTCTQFLGLHTLLEGAEQLDYATVCRIADRTVRQRQYWRFEIDDRPAVKPRGWYLDQAKGLLRTAVGRCTRTGRVGVLLSGGEDSRTIVGFLDDPAGVVAVTYTGLESDQKDPWADVAVSRELAVRVSMEHRVIRYDPKQMLQALQDSVYATDGAGPIYWNFWQAVHRMGDLEHMLIGDECFGPAGGRASKSAVLDFVMVRPLRLVRTVWPYLNPDRLDEFMAISDDSCARLLAARRDRPANCQIDELWHCQGLARFVHPKRYNLTRLGTSARRPLLDLDVLQFLRRLPLKHRLAKRLVRRALAEANPAVSGVRIARDRGHADFAAALASMEREGGKVSTFVLEGNPLFEQFFDPDRVRELISDVASTGSAPKKPARPGLSRRISPPLRRWLVGKARRYLGMRAPYLTTPTARLIRIATVAALLRHAHGRCAKPNPDSG